MLGAGFVAGTLIHADKGLVPIEHIKIGDMVLSKPEGSEGEPTYKRVIDTFSFNEKPLWATAIGNIETEKCEVFVTTNNHPFWVKGEGWSAAEYLQTGDVLQPKGSDENSENTHYVIRSELLHKISQDSEDNKAWMTVDRSSNEAIYIDLSNHQVSSHFAEWFSRSNNYKMHVHGMGVDGEARVAYTGTVYNFEVEDFHTYYIGNQGVWVHNADCHDATTPLVVM